jgi:hypothetical protein
MQIAVRLTAATVALLILASASWAQETVRLRGKIERIDGDVLVVKSREGQEVKLRLAPGGGVSATAKASLADIKPGSYIGVGGLPQPDGSQRAISVHIFHESMRGLAEGHMPWDLVPNSTMTNATIDTTVGGVDGQVVTLKYKGGEKKIIIPSDLAIVSFIPGEVSELQVGKSVFVGAAVKQPDGTLLARRIGVGRDVAPPM